MDPVSIKNFTALTIVVVVAYLFIGTIVAEIFQKLWKIDKEDSDQIFNITLLWPAILTTYAVFYIVIGVNVIISKIKRIKGE